MADEVDCTKNARVRGGHFVLGLLTGAAFGTVFGLLFAPRSGSELRKGITARAEGVAKSATESCHKAADTANEWAGKGRGVYEKARETVVHGTGEAHRYASWVASRGASRPS